tara:strand:- start:1686 stop:5363 length:3678 start_codon:yes stop_codon:yes gene_type:complete
VRNVRTLLLFISIITHGIYAQEICPIENPSVLGGDSQNIIAWNEPANPFLVTFTVSITPDSWPTEISWGLVNSSGDSVAGAAPGDLTNAGEVYTWDNEIEHGSYTFTIYDTFGDGNSGGFILYIDGSAIFTFDGSEAYTEYEVVFNTQEGWFGATTVSYLDPVPFEKGEAYDLSLLENLELSDPLKVATGNFEIIRDVPVECGEFVTYRVHRGNGSVIGTTTELEYAHTGLDNGTEYCYYVTVAYDTNGTNAISAPSATLCATPEEWVAAAPSNLMSFPGDEEMLLVWQGPGGGGGGGTEGDKIENPFIVTGLPFSASGTTVGFEDDYDEVCPYTGSTSPDVVYMMTSSGGTYDITLCDDSQYDTKVYVLDVNGDVIESDPTGGQTTYGIACNDDECTTDAGQAWVSQLVGLPLDAGLFYVVIDGYSGDSGDYTLDISVSAQNSEPVVNNDQTRTEYDFLGYDIFVDDSLVNSEVVEFSSYTAEGIENEITYTFGVAAVYDGPVGGDNYHSDTITVQDAALYLFGDISGVIYDPNNAVLDSVVVTAGGVSDTTGADGAYTLWNLNVGTHVVQASRTNFYTNTVEVGVLAQAAPTVQDITLSPDMPTPVALAAEPGDEKVYLSWRSPGSVAFYDIAYYDDVFEGQIGCGAGGCAFGVRFTPANYPATLQGFVLGMQGDAGSTTASVDVYLDPTGAAAGPSGDPVTVLASVDLSSPDGQFVQYSFDVSGAGIEVQSGDIYIVVNDGGGFLGLADDLEPISPEYFDRNWVTTGYGWNTIANEYYALAGDFGILASFLGAPGQAVYAVTASGEVVDVPELSYGRLSNHGQDTFVQSNISESQNILADLYVPRPVPSLTRNGTRDDSLEVYNVYQVVNESILLVATTTDTIDTITVSENYNNYCYHVKAQWNTGDPSAGGYGVLESRPSNTACAIPYAVGDANFDSETTIADVLALVDFILEETAPSAAAFNNCDINRDDALNIADVVMIVDIIAGTGTARVSGNGSMALVDLTADYQSSELLINLDYDGALKGMQFDLTYDPELVTVGAPSLGLLQDNVMITFNKVQDGLMKIVLADLEGEIIESTEKGFIKIPYSFSGNILDISSLSISDIFVSGPKGVIADVASRTVSADVKLVPGVFALHQNYPNPFNPKTEIMFDLPEVSVVDVAIYNLMGQKVKTLVNKEMTPGYHVMQWDGTNDKGSVVSTGMYFYTLNTNKYHAMRKMLFLK